VRHGEGLAAARDTEQDLRGIATLDAGEELGDGARLIPCWLEIGDESERSWHGRLSPSRPGRTMASRKGYYAILEVKVTSLLDLHGQHELEVVALGEPGIHGKIGWQAAAFDNSQIMA
jgi:hypothetical protein